MVSPSLELFKNCGDAALGDVVGDGLGLQLVVLEVFSNLRGSLISVLTAGSPVVLCWGRSSFSYPYRSTGGVTHSSPPPLLSCVDQKPSESKGIIIVAIIVCILVVAVLGSIIYFLHKKGKISCGRSGKQDM